jgi:hypothetical protein
MKVKMPGPIHLNRPGIAFGACPDPSARRPGADCEQAGRVRTGTAREAMVRGRLSAAGSPPAAPAAARRRPPAPRPKASCAIAAAPPPAAPSARGARRRAAGAGASAWLDKSEFSLQAEQRRPAQQRLRRQRDLQPGLVVGKVAKGMLRMPISLPVRIASSTRVVAQLQGGGVLLGLVGDEGGVSVTGLGSRGPRAGRRGGARGGRSAVYSAARQREVDAIGETPASRCCAAFCAARSVAPGRRHCWCLLHLVRAGKELVGNLALAPSCCTRRSLKGGLGRRTGGWR